jgi:phage-related protein
MNQTPTLRKKIKKGVIKQLERAFKFQYFFIYRENKNKKQKVGLNS